MSYIPAQLGSTQDGSGRLGDRNVDRKDIITSGVDVEESTGLFESVNTQLKQPSSTCVEETKSLEAITQVIPLQDELVTAKINGRLIGDDGHRIRKSDPTSPIVVLS